MGHQSSPTTTKRYYIYIAGERQGQQVQASRAHPGRYFFTILRKRSWMLDDEGHMTLYVLVEEGIEGCMACLVNDLHVSLVGFAIALGMEDQVVKVFPDNPMTVWASDLVVHPLSAVVDLPIKQPAEYVAALVVPAFLVRIDLIGIFLSIMKQIRTTVFRR